MMSVSGSHADLISVTSSSKLPIQFQTPKALKLAGLNKVHFAPRIIYGISSRPSLSESSRFKCSASWGINKNGSGSVESTPEPFWLTLVKEFNWHLRSLIGFLVEQPGQLKHIEWPSFQSTLKTATLTLVLVAMLIVALSSVDSALYYLLALLLRKSG